MEGREIGAAPAGGGILLIAVECEVAERAGRENGFCAHVFCHTHVLADHVCSDSALFELDVETAAARLAGVVDRFAAKGGDEIFEGMRVA